MFIVWDQTQNLFSGPDRRALYSISIPTSSSYLSFFQINFVPQHNHWKALLCRVDLLKKIFPPNIQSLKRIHICDIESQHATIWTFVECRHNRPESFLASSVPNLKEEEQTSISICSVKSISILQFNRIYILSLYLQLTLSLSALTSVQ